MKLQDIEGYTPITAKAIENVKCTRIISGEGSDKYNKYIQSLAKKVLIASLNRTDGYRHDEVGILARLDGRYETRPIYGYWDENLKTSIIKTNSNIEYNFVLDENMFTQTLVFVHNHPNNSILSINDLLNLFHTPEMIAIVAVGNNGVTKYAVKTSKNIHFYYTLASKMQRSTYGSKLYNNILLNSDRYSLHIGG